MGEVRDMFHQLSNDARSAAAVLETHTLDAVEAHRMHLNTSRSAADLLEVLAKLNAATRQEIENINVTATAVRDSLRGHGFVSFGLFGFGDRAKAALYWVLEAALHVDHNLLDNVFQLPVIRVVVFLLRLAWGFFYLLLSSAVVSVSSYGLFTRTRFLHTVQ